MKKVWIGIPLFLFSTIVLLEIGLRVVGYRPGYFFARSFYEENRFRHVDTLQYLKVFYPDSDGITKINQKYCENPGANDPIEHLYFDYICNVHLNSDGYRSREFSDAAGNSQKSKRKLFLLGDSFTYGFSAKPITNSFADILESNTDFEVYNGAVPGADPVTYLAVAKKFIHQINPDVVIVNFFLHNDEVYYPKKLIPNEFNDIFLTNAGAFVRLNYESIDKDSIEIFATPEDAYKNIFRKSSLLCSEKLTAKLASYFCISTLIWRFMDLNQEVNVNVIKYKKVNYTPYLLNAIKAEAEGVHARFILSFIPPSNLDKDSVLRSYIETLTEGRFSYNLISSLQSSDYVGSPDGHFNNSGHKKYASFLDSIILENVTPVDKNSSYK